MGVFGIHSFKVDPAGFGCKGMMFLGESGQGNQQPVYYRIHMWNKIELS